MWFAVETAFVDGKYLDSQPCFDLNLDPNYKGFAPGTTNRAHYEEPYNSCETHMNGRIEIHTDWFQTREQALAFCEGKLTYVIHLGIEYKQAINSDISHFIKWEVVEVKDDIEPYRGIYKRHKR